ncbi:endonuclease NucS domain-containing protein [Kribbella sp. NPDC020789]
MNERAKDGSLTEPALRDRLAASLGIIESGLELVKVEFALSNPSGAGGSIDILARDSAGLVVIELKKADQTARQALHELEKYVGLLASDQGIRVDQLRCILLSTHWHELLLPFSRFVSHADFHVSGRQLLLDASGEPVKSTPIELLPLEDGLEVCPRHLDFTFRTTEARDHARNKILTALDGLGVQDYVLLDLDYGGTSSAILYPFGCYVVFASFSEALRDEVRARSPEDCEEEPDDDPWFHEEVLQSELVGQIPYENVDASSPDRFKAADAWAIVEAHGRGKYANKTVWPISALQGLARADGTHFSAAFRQWVHVANTAAWLRMRSALLECLRGADPWPDLVTALLAELGVRKEAELGVSAYVPLDVVAALESAGRGQVEAFVPDLQIVLKDAEDRRHFRGCLTWNGRTLPSTVEETLDQVFTDRFEYFFAKGIGALFEVDATLCELHGLRYELFEIHRDRMERLVLDSAGNLHRVPVTEDDPESRPLQEYLDQSDDYLRELVALFEQHVWRWPSD